MIAIGEEAIEIRTAVNAILHARSSLTLQAYM